ncbi:hypothetical protein MFLO_03720 [Listeria floridensis FSL S10-1187]|uniref:Modifier protein of major autolysin LytC n=1 Tax=Listeria floridensis FSL S10-1187 TaxID=1265817 RepID=A0ABP3B0Y7_9LIST|nr:immunoglobulin-like domain-containing protein [Listeria floridensis]EUJ33220.1 hypothetical protein MFLO_03720 [Listeria floridensis FSL S10-1187]
MSIKKDKKFYQLTKKGVVLGVAALTFGSQVVTSLPINVLAVDPGISAQADESTVNVSSYSDFKAALANNAVATINLTGDIEFPSTTNVYTDARVTHSVTINGNGHTINMYKNSMNGRRDGANTVTFNNVNVIANQPDGYYSAYGLVFSDVDGYTINMNNVTYTGPQAIYNVNGHVNISGTTTLTATGSGNENMELKSLTVQPEAKLTMTSNALNVSVFGDGDITIGNGAEVKTLGGSNAFYLRGKATMTVESNAKVELNNKQAGVYGSSASFILEPNASYSSHFTDEKIDYVQLLAKNITLGSGSTFKVTASPVTDYAIRTNTGTFTFDGVTDFDINNTNIKGRAIYSYGSSTYSFNNETIGAWLTNNATDMPDVSWQGLTGTFKMSGYTTSAHTINDTNFNTNFKPTSIHRISNTNAVPPEVTVNALNDKSTKATGTVSPGSNVVIEAAGKSYIATVAADGSYSAVIDMLPAGTEVTVIAKRGSLTNTTKTIVADVTAPDAPTVEAPVYDDTLVLKGTAEANSTVTAVVEGNVIGTAKTDSTGNYQMNIPAQMKDAVISLTAEDAAGNVSAETNVTVLEAIKDYSLAADRYELLQKTLTGTFGKDVSKVRLWVNDKVVAQAETDGNGNYVFMNAGSFIKADDKVEIVAVDAKFVEVNRINVTVAEESKNYSLTVQDHQIGQASLSGKFGKDVSKVRLWVNEKVVAQAETNAYGNYVFPNGGRFIQSTSDKVEVVAVDAQYNEVNRIAVPLLEAEKDYKLTADKYEVGQAALNGAFGKDISKVRLWVNGSVVAQASINADGTYSFSSASGLIKEGDIVEVVAVDARYNEVNRITVTVNAPAKDYNLTADRYEFLQQALTGTFGKDISKVRLWVNGKVVTQAETDGNGNYSFPNAGGWIKQDDLVEIVAVDASYKQVNKIVVTVEEATKNYDLMADKFEIGQTELIGTFGTDISKVRLWVNGEVKAQAQLNEDGTYSFPNAGNFIKSGDLVEVVGVDTRYVEVNRITVNVTDTMDNTLTADIYELGQAELSGTFGSKVAFVRLWVNGEVKTQGEVYSAGNYVFTSAGQLIKKGDKVEIVAVDSRYQEVNRIEVPVKDYSLKAETFAVGDASLSGIAGKDILSVRLWVNSEVKTQKAPDTEGNFSFDGSLVKDGDKVELVAVDKSYKEVKRLTVL